MTNTRLVSKEKTLQNTNPLSIKTSQITKFRLANMPKLLKETFYFFPQIALNRCFINLLSWAIIWIWSYFCLQIFYQIAPATINNASTFDISFLFINILPSPENETNTQQTIYFLSILFLWINVIIIILINTKITHYLIIKNVIEKRNSNFFKIIFIDIWKYFGDFLWLIIEMIFFLFNRALLLIPLLPIFALFFLPLLENEVTNFIFPVIGIVLIFLTYFILIAPVFMMFSSLTIFVQTTWIDTFYTSIKIFENQWIRLSCFLLFLFTSFHSYHVLFFIYYNLQQPIWLKTTWDIPINFAILFDIIFTLFIINPLFSIFFYLLISHLFKKTKLIKD